MVAILSTILTTFLPWLITFNRHTAHPPILIGIIIDGEVLGTAIVPYGDGAILPSQPTGKLGSDRMFAEEID